jgi:HlyD family secretion protein
MSCRVETLVQRYADAVYVPIQAVTRVNRQSMVYVVEDGVLVPRPVEIGLDNNRLVHVLDGLNAGEVICLAPPLAAETSEPNETDPNEDTREPDGESEGRS